MRSPSAPFQYVTPRLRRRDATPLLYFAGSKTHFSRPVAASSATALMLAVVTYIVPSTTIGLAYIVDRGEASPVWYSHAGRSLCTLVALICARAANWVPPGCPRFTVQSTFPRKTGHSPARS